MPISPSLIPNFAIILLAAFAGVFGAIAAWRLYSFSNTISKDEAERGDEATLEFLEQQGRMPRPARRRTTQCFNLTASGAIRTVNGGYIHPFVMELGATMFADDSLVERRYDEAAGMLADVKPEDTILHFRIANFSDGGRALREHHEVMARPEEVDTRARIVHESRLDYIAASAETERFKDFNASVWAYVPMKHLKDADHNGAFVEFNRVRKGAGFLAAVKTLFQSSDRITRRGSSDEEEAVERAEKIFRQLEESSPVTLARPSRDDAWLMLYYGHNESAKSAPPTPPPHADLRAGLLRDNITARPLDWHVLHGQTPVAMISLIVPPEDGSYADILRSIYLNARLSRRFTVISEYKYLSKEKARNRLKRRSELLWKANVTRGGVKMDEETERAYHEIKALRRDLTRSRETIAGLDFRILVYGEPCSMRAEEKESVKRLERDCERIISVLRSSFPGCDVSREDGAALRALYHRSIVGEMMPKKSWRTIYEATDTLAPFIPLERAWRGIKNPHSLVATTAGNLIGLNFFQNGYTASPLGIIIGESGSGKSVAAIRFISEILATMAGSHGAGIDFGESFGPFGDLIGSRKWRFVPEEPKPINVWDYPGLEDRIMPDDTQKNFVIEDALILARAPRENTEGALYEAVVRKCVEEVYRDEVPNNRPGWPRHEPQHRHLVKKLRQFPFEGEQRIIALNLASILDGYVDNPWVDALTAADYLKESTFDIFELDSLDKFAPDIRRTLAFRVATRVCNRIGKLNSEGELRPTILVFDECQRIAKDYPEIMKAIRFNAARQGRKKWVFTLLCSQAWRDFEPIADITANAGLKIVGKQADDTAIDSFIKAANWTPRAKEAIRSIHNLKGIKSQFVISFGAGADMQTEMIQIELSPVEYWAFSTEPIEQNARQRVLRRLPQWTMTDAVLYLAVKHPRGLVAAGLTNPDLSDLPEPKELLTASEETALVLRSKSYDGELPRQTAEDLRLAGYRLIEEGDSDQLTDELREFSITEGTQEEENDSFDVYDASLLNAPEREEELVESGNDEVVEAEYVGDAEQKARDDVYDALENLFSERERKVAQERAIEHGR